MVSWFSKFIGPVSLFLWFIISLCWVACNFVLLSFLSSICFSFCILSWARTNSNLHYVCFIVCAAWFRCPVDSTSLIRHFHIQPHQDGQHQVALVGRTWHICKHMELHVSVLLVLLIVIFAFAVPFYLLFCCVWWSGVWKASSYVWACSPALIAICQSPFAEMYCSHQCCSGTSLYIFFIIFPN